MKFRTREEIIEDLSGGDYCLCDTCIDNVVAMETRMKQAWEEIERDIESRKTKKHL